MIIDYKHELEITLLEADLDFLKIASFEHVNREEPGYVKVAKRSAYNLLKTITGLERYLEHIAVATYGGTKF